MADFPASIFEPRVTANKAGVVYVPENETINYAEDYSLPADEIVAIEEALGIDPAGSYDTVKEWLVALQEAADAAAEQLTRIKTGVVPTGTVDGSNTIFELPEEIEPGSLAVYIDGVRLNPATSPVPEWEYNEMTQELTTYVGPQSWVIVDYIAAE